MIRAALLGAVLVHPILFVVAFLKGMVLGANPSFGGGPQSDHVFGWQGGLVSLEKLFFVYFITIGIALVIITVAGVVLGLLLCLLVRMLVRNRVATKEALLP